MAINLSLKVFIQKNITTLQPWKHKLRFIVSLLIGFFFITPCNAFNKDTFAKNLEQGKKQTIVTYGTSLTSHGHWVKQIEYALNELHPNQVTIINSANSGGCSRWGLKNLSSCVIKKKPDLVIIEFSFNDAFMPNKITLADSHDNLEQMINRLRPCGCEIILMIMNPAFGEHARKRPNLKAYNQIYKNVAISNKIILCNHYPVWQKYFTAYPKLQKQWIADGAHPCSIACHKVIKTSLLKAMGFSIRE